MDRTSGHDSTLIDVSGTTMLELLRSHDPRVTEAVRQLLNERQSPREVLLGWSSSTVTPQVEVDRIEECRGDPAR